MKEQIETKIMINANLHQVWKVLSNFQDYPTWSPSIKEFRGIPEIGKKSKILLQQGEGIKIQMNPLFLNIEKEKELRWKGKLWFDGIFDGEHYFILKEMPEMQTLLMQGEKFSGILVPFLRKMIFGTTLDSFNEFNQAIKVKVENQNL